LPPVGLMLFSVWELDGELDGGVVDGAWSTL
jgi:hypothetical protein